MDITVNNKTALPNKYVRFIKWKLYGQSEKFKHLHYAHVFLNEEGSFKKQYALNIKLGIPGKDVMLKYRAYNPKELIQKFSNNVQRYLAESKDKNG